MRNRYHYRFILLCLFSCTCWSLLAQDVQWASEVIGYSSQYGNKDYSAQQVLGVPNALGATNHYYMAWVPKRESSPTGEYIHVAFQNPMPIRQIAVAESLNPGAIHRIYLYDTQGNRTKIYENKDPRGLLAPYRLFRHKFTLTDFDVAGARIELRTRAVAGSNQIDAIGISASREPIRLQINSVEYDGELGRPERLSPAVNSEYAERLPIISPDGRTLYFARKYHPQNMGEDNNDDIWVSYRDNDGEWSSAVNIGAPLNNRDHNFVAAFNPSGDVLYLGSSYRSQQREGISVSYKRGRSWSNPRSLDIEDHYNQSEFVCYHLSLDGQVLLMAVERDEGRGGLDLYAAFRRDERSFGRPINLGPTINTVGSESSIFLAADHKTIYFSSNGHEGYGGYDMFISRRLDDSWQNWSKPQNLGNSINSVQNEYNYTIPASGEYAYFSSGDPSGMSDLYRIPLPEAFRPEPVMLISGRLINAETQQNLAAQLKVQELATATGQSDLGQIPTGDFQLVVPYGEDLSVYAEIEGYFATSENLALSGEELEGLDYDREASLAQQATDLPASSSGDSGAVEQLQLRLKQLDDEMRTLNQEREAAREAYRDQTRASTVEEDPELAALRHRYQNSLRAKREIDQQQYGQNEPTEAPTSSGDRELDELRKKFNRHYTESDDGGATTSGGEPSTASREEDQALNEMKRKYRQYYGQETGGRTESEPQPIPVESEYQTNETADLELLEALVRRELRSELLPEVQREWRRKLTAPTLEGLEAQLSPEEREQLERPGFRPRLIQKIQQASVPEVVPFSDPLLESDQWRATLLDLRSSLRPEVRRELQNEWKPQLREQIRGELAYEIKSATEQRIREALADQLQAERNAERARREQLASSTPPSTEEVDKQSDVFTPEYQEVEQNILLFPIKVGQSIPMNNIFFDSNQSTLKDASTAELQRVYEFLNKNGSLVVEIGGHTNSWCSHVFANELSLQRAQTVADYLVGMGISQSRLQFRGYGKTKPIATNETKTGRKKNQRVEMTIVEILP